MHAFSHRPCTIGQKISIFQNFQNTAFLFLYYSACKNLQQWSVYEVIEDILPFILNTKQPLRDIWLLRYKHKSFGIRSDQNFKFFKKHPKLFYLYLSNEISLRCRFVFKTNGRISFITSYKDHCRCFFTS